MAESVRSGDCIRHPQAGRRSGPPVRPAATHRGESRVALLDSSAVGLVEDLRRGGDHPGAVDAPRPDFQVCLPYRGLFVWQVGGDEVVGDANQVVFVRAGEGSRVRGPLAEGYGELIVTPRLDVLVGITRVHEGLLRQHPLFRLRARRAEPRLQLLRARLLSRGASASPGDELEVEELLLAVLRGALDPGGRPAPPLAAATARLIRRTKEYLEAELGERILLADVGRAVGACPTYLTDLFRRVEGTSLHRYLVQLRLARALAALPHTDDLTGLALDLGFSSHSHFTAAFRRAFGSTPSQFRRGARRSGPVAPRNHARAVRPGSAGARPTQSSR
jgi:AraC-like DNA-binding protein